MCKGLLLLLLSNLTLIQLLSTDPAAATTPPQIHYVKTWGGTSTEIAYGVALDSADNAYITGYTFSFGPGCKCSKASIPFLKYNSSGNLQWEKLWSGSGSITEQDTGTAIAVNSSGDVYIAGYTVNLSGGPENVLLLKFNSTGSIVWQKAWGGSVVNQAFGVALDSNGHIYVTGATSYGAGNLDVFLSKFDSAGSLLWQKTWGGSGQDRGLGVAVDASGNIYVTGETASFGAGSFDVVLLKFNSAGGLLWQKTWGGSSDDFGSAVVVDASGNLYITGYTRNFGAGIFDVLLLKFDPTGALLWQRTWGGSQNEYGYGVAVDASGNAYVTGATDSFGAGAYDAFLLKLSSSGALLNQEIYGGPGPADNFSYSIVVNSTGDAFATGEVGEAPPYSFTTTGNSTLGTPTFPLSNPTYTLGNTTQTTSNPPGTIVTPIGNETYAGGYDIFLTLVTFTPISHVPLSSSLITLAGLLIITLATSQRRRLRA